MQQNFNCIFVWKGFSSELHLDVRTLKQIELKYYKIFLEIENLCGKFVFFCCIQCGYLFLHTHISNSASTIVFATLLVWFILFLKWVFPTIGSNSQKFHLRLQLLLYLILRKRGEKRKSQWNVIKIKVDWRKNRNLNS